VSFDKDFKRRRKHKKPQCKQQQNSQSQCCTSVFGSGHDPGQGVDAEWFKKNIARALAEASLQKKVKVKTKADDNSNAQGQGQICQADFNTLIPVAVAVNVDDVVA